MNTIWTTGRTSLGPAWAELVFGAWLVISPFALGFSHELAGLVNNVVVGLVLILVTLASTRNGLLRGFFVLLGGWTYATGFVLNVSKSIYLWNNLILAVLIIATAVASESPYPDRFPRAPGR